MTLPKEQNSGAAQPREQERSTETLFPPGVLPTRRFVVELPGYKMEVPESRLQGRGYQMHRVTYPN